MKLTNIYCIVMATSLLSAISTTAMSDNTWDIDYLPSSDYENAVGVGVYQFKEDDIGFYANFHLTLTSREPKYDELNITSFADPVTDRYKELMIFNFGITKQVSSNVSGYAGIGYVSVTGIAQKDDPFNILANDGKYYVDDPANDETDSNINAGLIFGTDDIVFNIGYQSFTSSAYFGIGSRF